MGGEDSVVSAWMLQDACSANAVISSLAVTPVVNCQNPDCAREMPAGIAEFTFLYRSIVGEATGYGCTLVPVPLDFPESIYAAVHCARIIQQVESLLPVVNADSVTQRLTCLVGFARVGSRRQHGAQVLNPGCLAAYSRCSKSGRGSRDSHRCYGIAVVGYLQEQFPAWIS